MSGRGVARLVISVCALVTGAHAQSLTYTKGQNVAPAYEGWEQAADGTKYFLFGYMNRNWEEELDVPVGAENGFALGSAKPGAAVPALDADQGQPTHFLPRRNRFVFRVPVPKGFGEKDEVVWTLTTHGKTEKAYASLRLDYVVDDVVKASETGALGAGSSSPEVRANKPPVVHIVEVKTRSVKAGETLTVVSEVHDDGIPRRRVGGGSAVRSAPAAGSTAAPPPPPPPPSSSSTPPRNPAMTPPTRITVGKNVGLHVTWYLYRGPGPVTFDPPQIRPWEDTRAGANSPWAPIWVAPPIPADGRQPVQVTFTMPGTYVLRCHADDGALTSDEELTIVVTR